MSFLAINLNRIRTERGLSMQALADLSGVNKGTIWRVESKNKPLRPGNIEKLAEALKVDSYELTREPFKEVKQTLDLDERILNQIRQATQESVQDALKDLHLKQGREYVPSVRDKLEVILKDLPEHKLQSLLEYALKIKSPPKKQA